MCVRARACACMCKCYKLAVATWTYSHSTNSCHHQQTHFHPAPAAQFLWLLFIRLLAIYIVLQNMASFTLSFRTWHPLSFRTWHLLLCPSKHWHSLLYPSEHGVLYFVLQNMIASTLAFRIIIIMEICKVPTLWLKALNKHSITHIRYIEMEMLSAVKIWQPA